MEPSKLPRREREKLAQRQEMLDAALALFSTRGYRNVSMHDIAAKAEFAVGTLYKFFKSKEDLYKALILETSYKFRDTLKEAISAPGSEIDRLRSYVRTKGQLFKGSAAMIRLYFAETQGADFDVMAGLNSEIREDHRRFMDSLAAIFDGGMKKKSFRKIAAPLILALALDSFTNAFLFRWLEDPEHNHYPEDPDIILNIFFKGLLPQEKT